MNPEEFKPHVSIGLTSGRFSLSTIHTKSELLLAQKLRYLVFQNELIGHASENGIDQDEFDEVADHLAIYDTKSGVMVATCRLNCSLYSEKYYATQEFDCAELLVTDAVKLELGRVCVHAEYRKGAVLMLIWRGIADYMKKTQTEILFGCGSIMTESPEDAVMIYKYLSEQKKVNTTGKILPTKPYQHPEFEKIWNADQRLLSFEETNKAKELLPALCRSYFDMGCVVSGPPAFDREFKCIDFLTVLELKNLDPVIRQKIIGS